MVRSHFEGNEMKRTIYPRLSPNEVGRLADKMRSDGYFAYLDGRTAYARKLNREADRLDAEARKMVKAG